MLIFTYFRSIAILSLSTEQTHSLAALHFCYVVFSLVCYYFTQRLLSLLGLSCPFHLQLSMYLCFYTINLFLLCGFVNAPLHGISVRINTNALTHVHSHEHEPHRDISSIHILVICEQNRRETIHMPLHYVLNFVNTTIDSCSVYGQLSSVSNKWHANETREFFFHSVLSFATNLFAIWLGWYHKTERTILERVWYELWFYIVLSLESISRQWPYTENVIGRHQISGDMNNLNISQTKIFGKLWIFPSKIQKLKNRNRQQTQRVSRL